MNCKDVNEKIPAVIKRETESEDRILFIDHIKMCPDCRGEYLRYLKIFYTLDQQVVQPEPELAEIKLDIKTLTPESKFKPINYLWPVAAAFLVILLSTILLISIQSDKSDPGVTQRKDIQDQLLEENWIGLARLVNDPAALAKNADQTIPVNVLLSKLRRLEQRSINKISIAHHEDNTLSKEIELHYFIEKLEQYKKFKSALSVREISDFLYVI